MVSELPASAEFNLHLIDHQWQLAAAPYAMSAWGSRWGGDLIDALRDERVVNTALCVDLDRLETLLLNLAEASEQAYDALVAIVNYRPPGVVSHPMGGTGLLYQADRALSALKDPLRLAQERVQREETADA